MCARTGIAPRRLTGWEPAATTYTLPSGATRTIREPEWDWVDRHIMREWEGLERQVCRLCGYPLALHAEEDEEATALGLDPLRASPENYGVYAIACPATTKLDEIQARTHKAEEGKRKNGRDPDRARSWFVRRKGDPMPDFHAPPEAL